MENLEEDNTVGEEYFLAAKRINAQEVSMQTEICMLAASQIIYVLDGGLSVSNLRRNVRWANAQDREFTVGHFSDQAEALEKTAVRVMHHSGRLALGCVKTETRLCATRAAFVRTRAQAEARVLEENQARITALRTENLVQYMMKERI